MDAEALRKLDAIQKQIFALQEEMRVGFASLPSVYVTQESINEARRESRIAKRYAFTAILASVGALGTYLGILL